MIDLTSTTDRTRTVVAGVRDDQLDLPTPLDGPVRQLANHLLGLCVAFRDAAAKLDGPTTNTPPAPVEDPLPDDWRSLLDARLGRARRRLVRPGRLGGDDEGGRRRPPR